MIKRNVSLSSYPRKWYANRWLSFFVSLLMMMVAGTEYMFSAYAPDLKTSMGYTQTEINFLGLSQNLGMYLGFYLGIIYDFTNARFVSVLAAGFSFSGWFLLYLGLMGIIPTDYLLMALFMFIQGNGSAALYTAAITNTIPKFSSRSKGTVVGILVSMFGLSSAIFTPLYVHAFDSNLAYFFLFFATLFPIISILGVLFLYAPHPISVQSIPTSSTNSESDDHIEDQSSRRKSGTNPEDWNEIPIKHEFNSLQIFGSFDFYLIFFVFMLSVGVGLTIINNLGSMVYSLGGDSPSALVTALAVCNCIGRLIFGFASDLLVKMRRISRSGCLFFALLILAFAVLYFVSSTTHTYYVNYWLSPGVILLGLSYGGIMAITPTLVHEFLGSKYFGGNWGIVRFAPAISSFVLSTLIVGHFYDLNVQEDGNCYGWDCFGTSLIINFVVLIFSLIGSVILVIRWYLFSSTLEGHEDHESSALSLKKEHSSYIY